MRLTDASRDRGPALQDRGVQLTTPLDRQEIPMLIAVLDDEGAVVVFHEWADEPSFADYLSSDAFARSGALLRPLVTAPPVSRRFRADLLETV